MRRIYERLVAIFNPQMRQVLKDHCYIALIDNPSKSLQIAAVRQSASAITLINNPCEEAQYAAITKNPLYLRFLKHPSEKLKSLVVAMNPDNITNIDHPSNELQMAAVKSKPVSILGISNPSEKVQTYVVDTDPKYISLIRKPSEDVQIRAVTAMPEVIKNIKEPCIEAIRTVAKSNPEYLEGLVLDDFTMKIIEETNPSATKYTKSAPISSLYNTLLESPDKFCKLSLSDNELYSLYDIYMKKENLYCQHADSPEVKRTNNKISDFCKNREIPERLQLRIVKDRLSNIKHLGNPEQSVLSYALLTMTGNEISDRTFLNRISEPIKALAMNLEMAICDYELQYPRGEILAYYRDKHPDYTISQITESRFEYSINEAYTKFQKATGLGLNPERHEAVNKSHLTKTYGNVHENPSGYASYLLYKKCNSVIHGICKAKETEIRQALDSAGLRDIKLDREEVNMLFSKGKVTLDNGAEIKRIKTPKGYSVIAMSRNNVSEPSISAEIE